MEIMSVSLTSLPLLIAFAGILTCAWKVVDWIWLRPKKLEKILRDQGLAGNSYRLYYGDMKENGMLLQQATSRPMKFSHDTVHRSHPLLQQNVKTYGKDCFTWLGPTPCVNIMDPPLMKAVFTKLDDFYKPSLNPLLKFLVYGLLGNNGDEWAYHRKIINTAFQSEKLKNMIPAFYHSISEIISKWERMAAAEEPLELDVFPFMQELTSDAIARTSFGSSHREGFKIFKLVEEQIQLTSKAVQGVYIPGWRFVPTKMNKRLKAIDKEIKTSLKDIIKKREKAIKAGEASNDDLLSMLIQSNLNDIKENGSNKNLRMSIGDVIDECKVFYVAGQETTALLLSWAMVLLGKYTEWQDRAREEVLRAFGKSKPEFDGLNHLKVVSAILYEVLRLYPALTQITRVVKKETTLGKWTLPAGVMIGVPVVLIHVDKELWGDDAYEFKPERFAEGVSKATKNPLGYLPFAGGPRICIGQNFALMEAKLALAMILQRFSFELSPSYAHGPINVMTFRPQYGAHILVHKL